MNLLRLGFVLRKTAFRAFAALIDRRVPGRLKLLALAATIFVVSPLNLLGDIPLLGILDDAALLSFVWIWFTRTSLPYVNTYDAHDIRRR